MEKNKITMSENRSVNMRRVLTGLVSPEREELERSGLLVPCSGLRLILLRISEYEDMYFDDRAPGDAMTEAHNLLQEQLLCRAEEAGVFLSVGFFSGISAVLVCLQKKELASRKSEWIIGRAIDEIERNFGLNLTAVYSPVFQSAAELPERYREAAERLSLAWLLGCEPEKAVLRPFPGNEAAFTETVSGIIAAHGNHDGEALWAAALRVLKELIPAAPSLPAAIGRLEVLRGVLAELAGAGGDTVRRADTVPALEALLPGLLTEMKRETRGDPLTAALELIGSSYSRADLDRKQLCEAAGVSSAQLDRLFRTRLGCAPGAFLIRYRVERAKELLTGSGMQIREIAAAVGLSPQRLTRNFEKTVGMLPGRYRTEHGEK